MPDGISAWSKRATICSAQARLDIDRAQRL
jgi:hypothetical protein